MGLEVGTDICPETSVSNYNVSRLIFQNNEGNFTTTKA